MKDTLCLAVMMLAALVLGACGGTGTPALKEIESYKAGGLVVSLLSEKGELSQGQNSFVVAFHPPGAKQAVDVGAVTLGSSMSMPGMAPMTAPIELTPTGEPGKFTATGEFPMSGSWLFDLRWNGPGGQGNTTFHTSVR